MNISTRKTARAILLTPQHEVLLIRTRLPWVETDIWMLPGGGIENGEDANSAVVREVYEETGATEFVVRGEAWRQELFIEAKNLLLKQRFFLLEANKFSVSQAGLTADEKNWHREYRWWSIDELEIASILTEPVNICILLKELISNGLPQTPIKVNESS